MGAEQGAAHPPAAVPVRAGAHGGLCTAGREVGQDQARLAPAVPLFQRQDLVMPMTFWPPMQRCTCLFRCSHACITAHTPSSPRLLHVYLRELDDKQRYALAGMMVPLSVAPGQELCMPGDPADSIWLLHDGELQASTSGWGGRMARRSGWIKWTCGMVSLARGRSRHLTQHTRFGRVSPSCPWKRPPAPIPS